MNDELENIPPNDVFRPIYGSPRPKKTGKGYYMRSSDNKIIFAKRDGEPVYAQDSQGNEVYPEQNDEEFFIVTSQGPVYAKKADKREFYPMDKNNNDIPIMKGGKIQFAQDLKGNQFYPQNADWSDQFHGVFARTANKTIKYPLKKDKRPLYRTDPNTGDEIYHIDELTGSLVMGKDADGNQIYAKRKNGDEFFAGIDMYARDKNNQPVYPVTAKGEVIFPKSNEGDEYYLLDDDGFDIYTTGGVMLPRYAQNSYHDDIYPIKIVDPFKETAAEIMLNDTYARDGNGKPFYPFDSYGNEFIMKLFHKGIFQEQLSLPASYPITNDNWIIVPEIKGKPHFLKTGAPPLTQKNVVGQILRDFVGFSDFVTDVYSSRYSRSYPKIYQFLPIGAVRETTRQPITFVNTALAPPNAINPPKIPNVINPPNIPQKPQKNGNWSIIMLVVFLGIISLLILGHFITKK